APDGFATPGAERIPDVRPHGFYATHEIPFPDRRLALVEGVRIERSVRCTPVDHPDVILVDFDVERGGDRLFLLAGETACAHHENGMGVAGAGSLHGRDAHVPAVPCARPCVGPRPLEVWIHDVGPYAGRQPLFQKIEHADDVGFRAQHGAASVEPSPGL